MLLDLNSSKHEKFVTFFLLHRSFLQPRFQGLSSLPSLSLRKGTLVAAGHTAPKFGSFSKCVLGEGW